MGFVVDKVALGQVFLRVLQFSPVNIIPPLLSKLVYDLGDEQYVHFAKSSQIDSSTATDNTFADTNES
jgi:hypothetical protein